MNELALRYEYLIRAGHNVGRLAIPAAHADIYRALERSFVMNRDNNDVFRVEELLFEYAFNCGEVVTNILNAIWQFEKDFENQLQEIDRNELNQIEDLLSSAKMAEIDSAIELTEVVFRRHGRIA